MRSFYQIAVSKILPKAFRGYNILNDLIKNVQRDSHCKLLHHVKQAICWVSTHDLLILVSSIFLRNGCRSGRGGDTTAAIL